MKKYKLSYRLSLIFVLMITLTIFNVAKQNVLVNSEVDYFGLVTFGDIFVHNNTEHPQYPWVKDNSVTDRVAYKSTNNTGDVESSGGIEFNLVGPGLLNLDYKTSVEPGNYDYLAIKIDGIQQAYFSGQSDWQMYSTQIPSGNHKIELLYLKDDYWSEFDDTVWVSNIRYYSGEKDLTVIYDDMLGHITGPKTGSYLVGTKIMLNALPYENVHFLGWHQDGKLISTNLDYEFILTENTVIEARFLLFVSLPDIVLNYNGRNTLLTDEKYIIDHHYFEDGEGLYIIEVNNLHNQTITVYKNGMPITGSGNKYIIANINETTMLKIIISEDNLMNRIIEIEVNVFLEFPEGIGFDGRFSNIQNDSIYPWVFDAKIKNDTNYTAYRPTNTGQANSVSSFEFVISGPGILYFDYNTQSQLGADYLRITVNGNYLNANQKDKFSGNRDWQTTFIVLEEAKNHVKIAYYKDHEYDELEDAVWVANFGFNLTSIGDKVKIGLENSDESLGTLISSQISVGLNSVDLLTEITVEAMPHETAYFIGWRDENQRFISYNPVYHFVAFKDSTVEAVFFSKSHVARIGSKSYLTLEDALINSKSGDIVVLMQDVILSTDVTVPMGVMLLIPYAEDDYFGYVDGELLGTPIKINPNGTVIGNVNLDDLLFRTLSIPSGITMTVKGTVMVNAVTGRPVAGNYDQDNTGGYGQINLDGNIEVLSGGLLDVYGFVKGSGQITAFSGAEVGDLFVVKKWRGGSVAAALYLSGGIFPFNEYECNNIETVIQINKGASYYGNVKLYAQEQYLYAKFYQISNHSGIFNLIEEDAYVIREYDSKSHYVTYAFYGGFEEVGGTLSMLNIELTTKTHFFPINGNVTFILNNGEYNINNKVKFLPGSKLIVEDSATLMISSEGELIIYEVFDDAFIGPTAYPSDREPAAFELYGTLEIKGGFGGKIKTIGFDTQVIIGENARVVVASPEAPEYDKINELSKYKVIYEIPFELGEFTYIDGLTFDWYYYNNLDDNELWDDVYKLVLAKSFDDANSPYLFFPVFSLVEPLVSISSITNGENVMLKAVIENFSNDLNYHYWWYKDGILLVKTRTDTLELNEGRGVYHCLVSATINELQEFSPLSNFITVEFDNLKNINDDTIAIELITDRVYNGLFQTPKVVIKDGGITLVETIDYETIYSNNLNEGLAVIRLSGIGNYTGEREVTFKILPKEVSVTWSVDNFTYDGTNQVAKITAFIEGDIYANLSLEEFTDYGTYHVSASLANYIITNPTMTYHMLAKAVTITWTDDDFTYNGANQKDKIKAYIEEGIFVKISIDEFVTAGQYLATATLDNANYELTNETKVYTMKPKTASVMWTEDNFIYDGTDQSTKITAHIEDEIYASILLDEFKDFGTYLATASLSNYIITNPTMTYHMKSKTVLVSWVEDDFTYNGTNQSSKVKAYIEDEIEIDILMPDFINVGHYLAYAFLTNPNYVLTNTTKTYQMKVKSVAVTWVEDDFTYDGTNQSSKVKAYIEDNVDVEVALLEFKDFGTYHVYAVLDNPNYSLTNDTMTYQMKAKLVVVNWTVPSQIIYNGFDQSSSIKATIEGVGDDGNIELDLSFDKIFKDAATYWIDAMTLNNNYQLTNNKYTCSILPLVVEVKWSLPSSFVYNGLNQDNQIKATINGAGNDGNLNLSLSFDKPFKNVGDYEVTTSLNNDNYVLTNHIKHYQITKALVKLIVDNQTSMFNQPIAALTYQIEGTVFDKDNLNVVLSTNAQQGVTTGEYLITATANNDNYQITIGAGVYTITKANQVLSPLTMSDLIIAHHQVTINLIEGAVYSLNNSPFSQNNIFNDLTPLTKYSISVKLLGNDNYYESNIVTVSFTTLADTKEFDLIVDEIRLDNVQNSYFEIKEALTILNRIGREHFDQIRVAKLEQLIDAYNRFVDTVHNEFKTAVGIGTLITSHVDIINVISKIALFINSTIILVFVFLGRKLKKE